MVVFVNKMDAHIQDPVRDFAGPFLMPIEGVHTIEGRHTPFTTGYTPQFFFGATDVTGVIRVADGVFIAPGDQAEVAFELGKPVGIEKGIRFAIREGGKTVGAGLVTEVA